MLEQYFLRPTTVDRIRSNCLTPQIEQYVEWMHVQKYAGRNITRRIALLCHFADFTRTNGATDLASASSLVERFGDHWIAGNRCWNFETRPKLRRDICSIIRQMLRLILEGRVTRERGIPPFQFQSEAPGFFKYLLEERGMNKLTVARYLRYLNRLADYLRQVEVKSLRDLSPQLLSSFVVEAAPKFARNTRRDLCGVVRTFLRFLLRERIVAEDLSVTFEVPRLFRLSDVPRSITWGEVRRVLEVVDRRTVRGRRDYAILLMLVTYGLRACEAAKLTLDDIDWKHERLQIPDRKVGNCSASAGRGRSGGINRLPEEWTSGNCRKTVLSSCRCPGLSMPVPENADVLAEEIANAVEWMQVKTCVAENSRNATSTPLQETRLSTRFTCGSQYLSIMTSRLSGAVQHVTTTVSAGIAQPPVK